jgi:hypothetical protein
MTTATKAQTKRWDAAADSAQAQHERLVQLADRVEKLEGRWAPWPGPKEAYQELRNWTCAEVEKLERTLAHHHERLTALEERDDEPVADRAWPTKLGTDPDDDAAEPYRDVSGVPPLYQRLRHAAVTWRDSSSHKSTENGICRALDAIESAEPEEPPAVADCEDCETGCAGPGRMAQLREELEELRLRHESRRSRVADALEQLRETFTLRPNCAMIDDAVEDACAEMVALREDLTGRAER